MTNRNKLGSKLFILIAVLLFAWVGASCKNKNVPGGEGGMDINKPNDTNRTIGNVDNNGLLTPDKQGAFNDEMLLIQLLAVSEDGGYYRNPVVAAVNGNNSGKIITVMEKRYGKFTLNDVAVDGSTKVELVYLVSAKAGSGITAQPAVVGKGVSDDPRTQSRGVPVVFTKSNDSSVLVVAAGGTGFVGTAKGDKDGSKIYTISGTLNGTSVNWKNEGEIKIVVTNSENKVTTNGTEAILTYAREKFNEPKVNSVYLSSGVGVVDGNTYVLPLVVSHVDNQGYIARDAYFGTVVIYSDDGQTWRLGAYKKWQGAEWGSGGYSSTYREVKGINSTSSGKITIAARPNCYYDKRYPKGNIGLYTGDYKTQTELRISTGVEDAMGSFEFTSNGTDYYLINTRDRETSVYNKKLVIATTDKGATTSVKEMIMTAVSGGGSAVALSDNSIITICEEAFVLGSTREERKFNLVLRRFTKGYLEKNMNIPKKDRYYNPSYDLGDAGFNYPINPNREGETNN